MMPRSRSRFLPALFVPALPLALVLLAGCSSSSSSAGGTVVTAPAAHNSQAATVAASQPASAGPVESTAPSSPATAASAPATAATTPATAPAAGGSTASAQPQVFLAEGGDVNGTSVYRPACGSGCGLSGDGTTALWNMTWTSWTSTQAVGAGTEKIDDCNPNCAAGTLHAVAVRVTLSKPVMVCASGKGTWYWTRVAFTWPDGLPAAFSGDNAPTNPFDYDGITAQRAASCA